MQIAVHYNNKIQITNGDKQARNRPTFHVDKPPFFRDNIKEIKTKVCQNMNMKVGDIQSILDDSLGRRWDSVGIYTDTKRRYADVFYNLAYSNL